MSEPRVPGDEPDVLELPCGERLDPGAVDLGMREYRCPCGRRHAVVLDVHPPTRFFPAAFVDVLRETIETADDFDAFGTPHLLGIALEEFPEKFVVHDAEGDGSVGYAMLWVADFDARRLHEIVVELVVELMDHAVSHADDDATFVEEYRAVRNVDSTDDRRP